MLLLDMYSSHYIIIKHSSHYRIIKYIDFKPIHYTINQMLRHSLEFIVNLIMYFYRIYF